MSIQEVSIGMKRGLYPFSKLLVGSTTEALSRSDGGAAVYERTQYCANMPGMLMG